MFVANEIELRQFANRCDGIRHHSGPKCILQTDVAYNKSVMTSRVFVRASWPLHRRILLQA